MSNKQETKYAKGVFGNYRSFDNGGEIYGLDIVNLEEFKTFLDESKGTDGKVRLNVQRQKADPSKLSISLNTYVPKGQPVSTQDEDDDLPF